MKNTLLKNFFAALMICLPMLIYAGAPYQVPNAGFEETAGNYEGVLQPATWHLSNVEQLSFKFAIGEVTTDAHSGSYAIKCQDKSVGAMGITEVSPSWVTLGVPWAYLEGMDTGSATAGTTGGIAWTARPDTMAVWVKRSTNDGNEDMNLVYYSWTGTSENSQYKSKNGGCTSTSRTDEESDICTSDKNECKTPSGNAVQVAQGWARTRQNYANWYYYKVPITYFNNSVPEKMNIILSGSNYPNKRANSGLYTSSVLICDDVTMIYSSKVHVLKLDGKPMRGFSANKTDYMWELGETATDADIPAITAYRSGRQLSGSEISITSAKHLGETAVIEVRAEDGSSSTTYRITFMRKLSQVSIPQSIKVGGVAINGFSPYSYDYEIEVPFGQTTMPEITVEKKEVVQTVEIEPCSVPGTAVVKVFAENTEYQSNYNLHFVNAALNDPSLADILVNGKSVAGYKPSKLTYNVEVPIGTTSVSIDYRSAYAPGAQQVVVVNNGVGAQSTLTVTAPGGASRVYKITCEEKASSYAYLNDLRLDGVSIAGFDPENLSYAVGLPVGTAAIPAITWVPGDEYQTVTKDLSAISGTNGTAKIIVLAGNKTDSKTYRIAFSTALSPICTLNGITIDGQPLANFNAETLSYTFPIAAGAPLPKVEAVKGDPYQTISTLSSGNKVRLVVTAQNGATKTYTVEFVSSVSDNANLKAIRLDGVLIEGFNPEIYTYNVVLPRGTTVLPIITYDKGDETQNVTLRPGSVNGVTKLVVTAQSGKVVTYQLNFTVPVSSETALSDILLNGESIAGFHPDTLSYAVVLPSGTAVLPEISYVKHDELQKVKVSDNGVNGVATLSVTAEDGSKRNYVIAFSVEKSANAGLLGIYVDGVMIPGFDKDVLDYTYQLLPTQQTCPELTVAKMDGQVVSIIVPLRIGKARITVTPETGAKNVYTVNFTDQKSGNCSLSALNVNGVLLEGFASDRYDYSYTLPAGTTTMPVITYSLAEPAVQTATLITNGLQGASTITVRSESGTTATYTIGFNIETSSTALLDNILFDGVTLEGFKPTTFTYQYTLPKIATSLPAITYVKGAQLQQVDMIVPALQGVASIKVTAADGKASNTYQIAINTEADSSSYLKDLTVNGVTVSGFAPNKLSYEIMLQYGDSIPSVNYLANEGQSVVLTNDYRGCVLLVTSEIGTSSVYTLNYRYQASSQSALADLQVYDAATEKYLSLPDFKSDKLSYDYSLEWRTKLAPTVNPVFADKSQTAELCYGGPNGTTTITVTAGDGVSKTVYTIDFATQKSANAALSALLVGEDEIVIEEGVTSYQYTLPYGTRQVPMLSYEKGRAADGSVLGEQSVMMTVASLDSVSSFVVTAEDGTQQTYTLRFKVASSNKPNVLSIINIGQQSVTVREGEYTYSLELPYGTSSLPEISYVKKYDEQTVFVSKGRVGDDVVLQVLSNMPGVEDVTYTIHTTTAKLPSYVLSGVTGCTLYPAFDPMVSNYVATVDGNIEDIAFQTDETHNDLSITSVSNQIEVVVTDIDNENLSTSYTFYVHYNNDVIPNADFTQWTTPQYTAVSGAIKPTSWHVPADAVGEVTLDGVCALSVLVCASKKAYAGYEITNPTASVVGVNTKTYQCTLAGQVPAILSLGDVSCNITCASGSSSSFSGGITFRNTPDRVQFRYNYTKKANDGALFAFRFFDDNGEINRDVLIESKTSDYVVTEKALELNGIHPNTMNIAVNPNGNTFTGLTATNQAEVLVDYFRFSYNANIASIKVAGAEATRTNKQFTATIDAETVGVPAIEIKGEVNDQSYEVLWSDENNRVRTATIRSFAEDASSVDYQLTVTREPSSNTNLKAIKVNGVALADFVSSTYRYQVPVLGSTRYVPDVEFERASSYQQVRASNVDGKCELVVTAENGAQATYVLEFVAQKSNDTSLKSLSVDGYNIPFDAAVTEYDLLLNERTTNMPAIRFEKQSDAQLVVLDEKGVGATQTIRVVAENGSDSRVYSIRTSLAPYSGSQSYLNQLLVVDGNPLNFAQTTYAYTYQRAADESAYCMYVAQNAEDALCAFISTDSVDIAVSNAVSSTAHHYTLVYSNALSNNAQLRDILFNGASLAGFNANVTEYECSVAGNAPIALQALLSNNNQTLQTTYDVVSNTYFFEVGAADGVTTKTYSVQVKTLLSDNASLAGLYLNGVLLEGFGADTLNYELTLPIATPKLLNPAMPDILALGATPGQVISIENNGLDASSYITVTAENGINTQVYTLSLKAAKSSCAYLDAIYADGVLLTDFAPNRTEYAIRLASGQSRPTFSWQRADAFQNVEEEISSNLVKLNVSAEDGATTVYQIRLDASFSDDTTIEGIKVGGKLIEGFNVDTLSYSIQLPQGTTVLPDIMVVSGAAGQTVDITNAGVRGTSVIVVTAENGLSTKTYEIHFSVELSNITWLKKVEFEGFSGFDKDVTHYKVSLPLTACKEVLPDVVWTKGDEVQTVDSLWNANQLTLHVTAENGVDTRDYVFEFSFVKSEVVTLANVQLDARYGLFEFQPDIKEYKVVVPPTVRTIPVEDELTITLADACQTIQIQRDTLQRIITINVTAVSGARGMYSLQFEQALYDNADLQEILIDGNLLEGFAPDSFEYAYHLPIGTTQLPQVAYTGYKEYNQTLSHEDNGVNGVYAIMVTAESGRQQIYRIAFSVLKSDNASLKSITVNETIAVELFADEDDYEVLLAYGTEEAVLSFEKGDEDQHVVLTQALSLKDTATIRVTAEDGVHTRTYRIRFKLEPSHEANLQMIYYNAIPIEGFEGTSVYQYDITLPFGTNTLPVITWDSIPDSKGIPVPYQSVVLASHQPQYDDFGNLQACSYTITVVAEDGVESNEYVIDFEVGKSTENRLSDLKVFGKTIKGFDADVDHYLLQYPPYTDASTLPCKVEDFAWQLVDSNHSKAEFVVVQTAAVICDTINGAVRYTSRHGIYNIRVVAANGNLRTYAVETVILLSDNTRLDAITINGKLLDNFDPDKREYSYILPFGMNTLDTTATTGYQIGWQLQEVGESVDVVDISGLTYTIYVTAQNGTEEEYVIQFAPDDYDPTSVPTADDVCITSMPDGSWKFTTDCRMVYLYLADVTGRVLLITNLNLVDENVENICDERAEGYRYYGQPGQVVVYYFVYALKTKISTGKFRVSSY